MARIFITVIDCDKRSIHFLMNQGFTCISPHSVGRGDDCPMKGENSSILCSPSVTPTPGHSVVSDRANQESANSLLGGSVSALCFLQHSRRAAGAPLFILAFY